MSAEGALAAKRPAGPVEEFAPALIGPHAVIHTVEVMRERLGAVAANTVLAHAQIEAVPSGECMIPEIEALRLHRWLALWEPIGCFPIAEESARRTADYIIAHRIPAPAAWLLRHLPRQLAAAMLMRTIRRHAWTFVGAGRFLPNGAWSFTIDRSEADDPIRPPDSLYVWYAAVFARLFQCLVDPGATCSTRGLGAMSTTVCEFRIVAKASSHGVCPPIL